MAIVFGILFIDYLKKGKTIIEEYYALLDQLNDPIKKNVPI